MDAKDWKSLPFGYQKTNYNVRCYHRDGKWGALEVSSSEKIDIHIAATCLHYGQEAFEGLKARVILQEFIKESGGADIRAFVVNGEVVGAMKRQGKAGEFRSNLHRGGSANIIKLSRAEKSAALKAADSLGLSIAGVDMLQSKRGPLILEVNSSPGLEGIETATKVDIGGKIVEYIEKSMLKKRKKIHA